MLESLDILLSTLIYIIHRFTLYIVLSSYEEAAGIIINTHMPFFGNTTLGWSVPIINTCDPLLNNTLLRNPNSVMAGYNHSFIVLIAL